MVLYFTGTGNSRYLARRIAEGVDSLHCAATTNSLPRKSSGQSA